MDEQLKTNLLSSKTWIRLVYMAFFAVCLQVAAFIMWVLVVLQFLFALITGADNTNLRKFGSSLSTFIFSALKFLTFNSEDKPFPFADWPKPEEAEALEGEVELAAEVAESAHSDVEEDVSSVADDEGFDAPEEEESAVSERDEYSTEDASVEVEDELEKP